MRKKRLWVNWKAREKNTEKKQIEHITNEKRKLIRNIIKEIFPKLKKDYPLFHIIRRKKNKMSWKEN